VNARIIVTGAASGIGAATVRALRARDARVVGLDVQPGDGVMHCDVRDPAQVDRCVRAAIAQLDGLDVLINNAGIGEVQSAGTAPDQRVLEVLDVNLFGAWRVTAAALPALRAYRGRVVNVASGLAFLTLPFSAAYCASKRALVAYSDALRLEHGDAITVTTVYPGYIRTPIHRGPAEQGLSLETMVPAESIDDAVKTLLRAALGRPARDLATTRRGAVAYWLLRRLPGSIVDRGVLRRTRRAIASGGLSRTGLAADLAMRLEARPTVRG
jgi:NAD(P)-dependent dehydrogenase (short-subunit alcohol dehydrogenase family)